MEQLSDLADKRLITSCIYCGAEPCTREHTPSKVFLDQPFPDNLPIVGCCQSCNNGFSLDEEYLASFIEVAKCGTTDPEKISRPKIANTLRHSKPLRELLQASKREFNGEFVFEIDESRLKNVVTKLAKGHAAFELSVKLYQEPSTFFCAPLHILNESMRSLFDEAHFQDGIGEIGSRNSQRLAVVEVVQNTHDGSQVMSHLIFNDWIDLQEDRYRYLAIHDHFGISIRIVFSEYLACIVSWNDEK